jgi:hypothetical protein
MVKVDGATDGIVRPGSSVKVVGVEVQRAVVPHAAREADVRPTGEGPVREGLTGQLVDGVGEGFVGRRAEGFVGRRAEDGEQLFKGAFPGAGGHQRERLRLPSRVGVRG